MCSTYGSSARNYRNNHRMNEEFGLDFKKGDIAAFKNSFLLIPKNIFYQNMRPKISLKLPRPLTLIILNFFSIISNLLFSLN